MNKRGKAGETLLHMCFSNGTYLHMLIARRLIQIFPNMINDICVGDELYGMIYKNNKITFVQYRLLI